MAKYYYLIDVKQVAKDDSSIPYLFVDGEWQVDNANLLTDRLIGYDPVDKNIGNTSILEKVISITEDEIQNYI